MKKGTTYQHWYAGRMTGFGSFDTALLKAFQLADASNTKKLKDAFPELFVTEFEVQVYTFVTE